MDALEVKLDNQVLTEELAQCTSLIENNDQQILDGVQKMIVLNEQIVFDS